MQERQLIECGHYYISRGITQEVERSIVIGQEFMYQHYGDYDTMLFVDDVHTDDATDPYIERMTIETGAKYVVKESDMEVLAKHLFEDYGIDEKVGGLRIRTSAGRMTCLAMDYALCIYKYNLGYIKSYICIDKSFENQQRNLHSLLRQLKEL